MPSTFPKPAPLCAALALFIAGSLAAATVPAATPETPAPAAAAQRATAPALAYTREVLPNGLTLIVHEDRKAPVVAVSIWYHIGSADEPAGKTGFAHLFEHLMFSGSENHRGSYFDPFETVGVSSLNGTTWFDRTNYYETVPSTAVDMALWMESDRMGHLLGAIGQKELDAQRGVVQNEKRQGENNPLGRVSQNVLSNLFPANHPYQHDSIGSMADLDAASLDDVKNWFRAHYGAANVTLVLAGDIDFAEAKAKVLRYFGDIPAGPPVARQQPWTPAPPAPRRGVQHDHVPQPHLRRTWVAPNLAAADAVPLTLAMSVLGSGKTSRLYQRLVLQDKLVDNVVANMQAFELAGMAQIYANVKAGVDPARVEAAIDEELRRFVAEGPTADELERVRIGYRGLFVRALEDVGTKAAVLAEGQVYRDDPTAYVRDLDAAAAADAGTLQQAAARWLTRPDYRLLVQPAGEGFDAAAEDAAVVPLGPVEGRPAARMPEARAYSVGKSEVDRSLGVPEVTRFPDLSFPTLQRARLKNGVEVVLAERHAIPVTEVQMIFNAGAAADPQDKPGLAAFTASLMGEGTRSMDATEIAKKEEQHDASTYIHCEPDFCHAHGSALNDQFKPMLGLLAERVRNPAFADADIARVREQTLTAIAREKQNPNGASRRVLPGLLYGPTHGYGHPANGNEASIAAIGAADMQAFHRGVFRPDQLTITVAGDTTMAQLLPELEAAFGDWTSPAESPLRATLAAVPDPGEPRVFLIDRPDSPQSQIVAAFLAPSSRADDQLALDIANEALGGAFTSRLNMNLREDKHWAYGAYSAVPGARGQRTFLAGAGVQSDKTAESVAEIVRELREVVGSRPLTAAETGRLKDARVRSLPGTYQRNEAVLDAVNDNLVYGRPDDYVQTLKGRVDAITAEQAQAALAKVVKPQSITLLVIGDLAKIEPAVRALGVGEVRVIDADGRPTGR